MAESGRNRNRNWTELPDELTSAILSRLGAVEILLSAQKVCMKWRKISTDPLFWRKINMRNDGDLDDWNYEAMFRHVFDRSSDFVVDINIEHFGNVELLAFITKSVSTIRRIRLFSCHEVSGDGVSRMASELRLLEELDISLCMGISHEAIKAVGRSCPLLKTFKFNKEWCRFSDDESDSEEYEPDQHNAYDFDHHDAYDFDHHFAPFPFAHAPAARVPVRKDENADAIAIAGTMQGLHHLQLCGNKLTDDGLRKILDCCPHLESLDLRLCFNLNMGIDLDTRCSERIKRFWLPHDSIEGKGFTSRSDGYCFKWVELPDDVTLSILSRLGTVDILDNAQKVCKKWRKVCKEMKWNTIDMHNDFAPDISFDYDKMCHHVVDLSCGNLVDVNMEDLISDELLGYITDSSKADVSTVLKVRTSLRSPPSGADDSAPPPSGHQWCPRPLSLLGEPSNRYRWEGKVVGDTSGVRLGGGAPLSAPDSGERRDVHTLRAVRMSAPDPASSLSSGIRRLRLSCSYNISDEGLIEVASKLLLLEELDISVCENLSHKPVKVLGRSCPLLKSFKLNKKWHKYRDNFCEEIFDDDGPWSKDDDALAIAGTMHGLHHLQLFGNQLTNVGLRAILDGCPHLESLDLRYCFNLDLEGDLGRRCCEIRKLLLPTDSIAGYGLMPSTNWRPPRETSPPSPKLHELWAWDFD
ncbi:hypothetical protein ACLB2K_028240 [Fragaria x ananassa]